MKDVRTLNLWRPDASAGVRHAVWASVVPPLVFFVLAVALSLGATTPFAGSLWVFVIAAFAASAVAASWVSVRLVQHLRATSCASGTRSTRSSRGCRSWPRSAKRRAASRTI